MPRPSHLSRRTAVSGIAVAALAGGLAPSVAAQEASPAPGGSPEEAAVGQTLMQMAMAFAQRDADAAASVYTEDVEWLNAFGDWVTGRENVHAKLAELFSTEEFDAGRIVGEPTGSVRIIGEDTAVGWTYQEIEEQQIVDTDKTIPLRKNHSLAVLVKRDDAWLITAHMFMDENITE